jgi:hypothetical protein
LSNRRAALCHVVGSGRDEGREDYISRPSPLICELIAIVWTLQVNDLRETLYCTYIYSLEECVNVFFTKMEDTYRFDSNEKWICEILGRESEAKGL